MPVVFLPPLPPPNGSLKVRPPCVHFPEDIRPFPSRRPSRGYGTFSYISQLHSFLSPGMSNITDYPAFFRRSGHEFPEIDFFGFFFRPS